MVKDIKKISLGILLLGATTSMIACKDKTNNSDASKKTEVTSSSTSTSDKKDDKAGLTATRFAYVDADTLSEKYLYLAEKRKKLEAKQAASETEINNLGKSLQNQYAAFQKKAQEGTLTQAEGEAGQKKLMVQQQNLEKRTQTLQAEMFKEQEAINKEFKKRLNDFLTTYNADKKYDFIFSHSEAGGQILYANPALNITDEILNLMNKSSDSATTAK